MIIFPRSDWTSTLPKGTVGPDEIDSLPNFNPQAVLGTVVHFVGSSASRPLVQQDTKKLLENIRKNDMNEKSYSDIMYNLAVSGREEGVWELRGLVNRGAANGNSTTNGQYPSVLAILAVNEKPSDLLLNNVRAAVSLVNSKFPTAVGTVKGHRDMRSTVCPGDLLYGIITNPKFWEKEAPKKPAFTCPLPDVSLRVGDKGTHVFSLISQLSFWGYYSLKNDGVYGEYTKRAVATLQEELKSQGRYSYGIDGQYGKYTRAGWCGLLEILYQMAG